MGISNIHQLLLLFYIYCFIGWVWESVYVSINSRKLVNRGFLKGPFLPIYGSGAIVVLLSTLIVEKNIILVFIIGMIAATILEYITGAVMEKMFHVRYWDYSNEFYNINGHICLTCSLAWGVFSIVLVKFANPPIENFIMKIPEQISEIITYIITIDITIDGVQSFNEAMDLKSVLVKFTERNEAISIIKRRGEIVEALISEDVKVMQEKLSQKIAIKQEETRVKKQTRKEAIEESIRKNLELKQDKIKVLSEKISRYIDIFEELKFIEDKEPSKLKSEFLECLLRLKNNENKINNMESRIYIHSINILRRNPNARAKKYEEAIREVKDLDKDLKEK